MNAPLVKVGTAIINLDAIAACHWDNGKPFVYFIGGRFIQVWARTPSGFRGCWKARRSMFATAI